MGKIVELPALAFKQNKLTGIRSAMRGKMAGIDEFAIFGYNFLEIFPGVTFQAWVAQEGCRMIDRHSPAFLPKHPLPPFTGDAVFGACHMFQRRSPQEHQDLWIDQFNLPHQPGQADGGFLGGGHPVVGRPAANDVADEHVLLTGKATGKKDLIEQLS